MAYRTVLAVNFGTDRLRLLKHVSLIAQANVKAVTEEEKNKTVGELLGLTEEEVAAAVEAHTTDGLLDPQIATYLGAHDSVEATVVKAHKITFTVTGTSSKVVPQVCIGGISINQVDSITLEAHDIPGLFIAGEALDIDAQCGGFNLSWAWKTGMVAGVAAAKRTCQKNAPLKEDN